MSDFDALVNIMHREALRVLHRQTARTPAVVDAYDPVNHLVKVRLMPDSIDDGNPVITGWLSLHPLQTGNGFGWHLPPNIGDHGWIEFHDDDREAGQFVVAAFNDVFQPVTVQAGEWLYLNKWGASVYFRQDGSVTITDAVGSQARLDGKGGIAIAAKGGAVITMGPSGNIVATDKAGNTVAMDGTSAVTLKDLAGDSITLKAGVVTVADNNGSMVVLDGSGNIQAAPGIVGGTPGVVYLGGTGSDGHVYGPVLCAGLIPSVNVLARTG